MNDFEPRLQRQVFRPPPPEWRDEILAAATPSVREDEEEVSLPWLVRLEQWLRPAPRVWLGFGAVWLLIAVLQLDANRLAGRSTTANTDAPKLTSEMLAVMKEQREELLASLGEDAFPMYFRREEPAAQETPPTRLPLMLLLPRSTAGGTHS